MFGGWFNCFGYVVVVVVECYLCGSVGVVGFLFVVYFDIMCIVLV